MVSRKGFGDSTHCLKAHAAVESASAPLPRGVQLGHNVPHPGLKSLDLPVARLVWCRRGFLSLGLGRVPFAFMGERAPQRGDLVFKVEDARFGRRQLLLSLRELLRQCGDLGRVWCASNALDGTRLQPRDVAALALGIGTVTHGDAGPRWALLTPFRARGCGGVRRRREGPPCSYWS